MEGTSLATEALNLAVALGIGLLLGAERERRKAAGHRVAEGIRTFALVALVGAVAELLGGGLVLAAAAGVVGALVLLAYALGDKGGPGITTEVAVLVTLLLGALAIHAPQLAAAVGVAAAVILTLRESIHAFVRSTLTETELRDGLLFAAAALVVLPLLPDRAVDAYGVVNPAATWRIVVIFMAISALGHVAVRVLGARVGLPVAGFFAGFVSSAAATGSMAALAKREPGLLLGAAGSAILAGVASLLFLLVLVGSTSLSVVERLAIPLGAAAVAAAVYAAILAFRSIHAEAPQEAGPGRAFDLRTAIGFAVAITAISFVAAFLTDRFGSSALVAAAAIAGLADTHAVAISAASLAVGGRVSPAEAALAILAAFTANQVAKLFLTATLARGRFLAFVGGGLGLMVAAAWVGRIVAG